MGDTAWVRNAKTGRYEPAATKPHIPTPAASAPPPSARSEPRRKLPSNPHVQYSSLLREGGAEPPPSAAPKLADIMAEVKLLATQDVTAGRCSTQEQALV